MSNKFNILVTWRLLNNELTKYDSLFKKKKINVDTMYGKQYLSEKNLIKKIHKYDGIICGDDEITKKVLDNANKLKVISKWGTGLDSIDLNYAKNKKIKVFNSPGAFTDNVSDHALALMFSLNRNIILNHNDILRGEWSKRLCENLTDKIVGIIGFGKIGQMIKKKLSGFKVNFLINDLKRIKFRNTKKDKIFKKSDILFLCVDLNDSSRNMISKKHLKTMKKNLILINICRGQVIKGNDLYYALKNNWIAGAGLDVHYQEPIKRNNKFLKLKNCILSSHNAFNSKSIISKINDNTVNNLLKGLNCL